MRAAAEERFTAYAAARSPGLLRLAFAVTRDRGEAEDVVQTALAKAYAAWPSVERAGDPDAYVRRMVVNAALDGHRRRARRIPEQLQADPVAGVAPDDPAEGVVSADAVRRLLAELPPRQRAVLALRFLDDRTEQATADALGITVGAVKSHTSKALSRLRELDVRQEGGHARQ